jgi:signal transduction histidine kinase
MQRHLRYLSITDVDSVLLRSIKPLIEIHAESFVEKFFVHVLAFEGTQRFLADTSILVRLKKSIKDHLISLFEARFDNDYYQQRCHVGEAHFRVGLDFEWFVGGYSFYLEFLIPLMEQHHHASDSIRSAAKTAIRKVVLLDMTVVLEAYHEYDQAALENSRAQIRHQEKLADIGLLASGLAHEIGNPLASILAVCDNQLRKEGEVRVQDKFSRIREQVLRITNLVRQLVNFARPEPARWQTIPLQNTIESALTIARLARGAKMTAVKMELEPTLPAVHGVPDQLMQVFLNLFLNAFDAMSEQNGLLVIRSKSIDAEYVQIEIQDNGSGIALEHLHKLFTPFFTTKALGHGTGLGLHICAGIVQRHGGTLKHYSVQEGGSNFTLVLPINAPVPPDIPNG